MSQKPKKQRDQRKQPRHQPAPSVTGTAPAADTRGKNWIAAVVCLALVAVVLAVFGQTARHDFVDYDDDVYVYENAKVTGGLTLNGVAWAFTHPACHFYHPLTMISLMLDHEVHGLHAGGYHLTNVLLHAASAVLLFLILWQTTGALWRGAFVAAVFAIHPLRVESVAWVAERKDVLSAFFFMLTLGAYVRYARGPSRGRYFCVVLLFALSLLAKPMAVTLPFLLLLLDYWPLNRFAPPRSRHGHVAIPPRLILEKIPLLLLSVAACVVAVIAQGTVVTSTEKIGIPLRFANALVSYATYMGQMVWPANLTPFYLYPVNGIPAWQVALSLVLLAAITAACLARWRSRPWLAAGWLWFLGMLVPMIGIVQVGLFAHADRFTYLPQIGLYVLLTWAVADLCAGWRHRRLLLGGLSTALLAALMWSAHAQTAHWRNSEALWTHTVACAPRNYLAQYNLGNALMERGQIDEAISRFTEAARLKPDLAVTHNNLGRALVGRGRLDEAIAHFKEAVRLDPASKNAAGNLKVALEDQAALKKQAAGLANAHALDPESAVANVALGKVMAAQRKFGDAISYFEKALRKEPDNAEAHRLLGLALGKTGKYEAAAGHFREALRLQPDMAAAAYGLGVVLQNQGRTAEALAQFRRAIAIRPDYAEAMNNLAWILATDETMKPGDTAEAVRLAERACELTHRKWPEALDTLAAAYATAGRFDEAVSTAQTAADEATAAKRPDLAREINSRIEQYRQGAQRPSKHAD